jgi:hypothetical protein
MAGIRAQSLDVFKHTTRHYQLSAISSVGDTEEDVPCGMVYRMNESQSPKLTRTRISQLRRLCLLFDCRHIRFVTYQVHY